jgi:hypothetical protein
MYRSQSKNNTTKITVCDIMMTFPTHIQRYIDECEELDLINNYYWVSQYLHIMSNNETIIFWYDISSCILSYQRHPEKHISYMLKYPDLIKNNLYYKNAYAVLMSGVDIDKLKAKVIKQYSQLSINSSLGYSHVNIIKGFIQLMTGIILDVGGESGAMRIK